MIDLGKHVNMNPEEGIQQDCSEFYWETLNQLADKYQSSDFKETFKSTMANLKMCLSCSLMFGFTSEEAVITVPVFHTYGSISVRSLLWNKCTGIYTSEKQIDTYCPNCLGDVIPGLHDTMFFLTNPTILAITTYRAHPLTGIINHASVEVEETLDISDLCVKYDDANASKYRIFAAINHIGNSYSAGHYTVTLFVRDYAITYDNENVNQTNKETLIKSTSFSKKTYMLFYVREQDVIISTKSFSTSLASFRSTKIRC